MSNGSAQADPPVADSSGRFRFRLVHLFYIIAVVASSLATFGGAGIVPAIVIVGFWAVVYSARSRPRALGSGCLCLVIAGCLLMCLLPAVQAAREAARRYMCVNNLKQISLALLNYHDDYRCFPPAYVADADGKPMHSWRVLILPYIEERSLYDQYDFSEPWDGPNNRKLLSKMPHVYACPSQPRGTNDPAAFATSYVAVVGPRTAWPGVKSTKVADITDGTSNTIMVVELSGQQIPWMEPRDPSLAEVVETLL
ncbi:MAG: DUF1559 domain-containing protein, partial [Planctomycetes bacterium]|nr:DUF1559 domain-containing protein [Planctomycetota bacterium]